MANGLSVDERLSAGENRLSENGQYRLDMQDDGNVVLYESGAPIWATDTAQ